MNYRWLVILACILVTACSSSTKEEAAKKPGEAQPAETIVEKANPAADLLSEYQVAFDEFVSKMRSAKRSERDEVAKTNPQAEFAEKFRTLASENTDSEIEEPHWLGLHPILMRRRKKLRRLPRFWKNIPTVP